MRKSLVLKSNMLDGVALRTIIESDCENLRQWKNANRFAFFFQEIITPKQQEEWFRGYCERENDYMFIVLDCGEAIGCMGFRLINEQADIYNVILGRPEIGGKGLMSKAMRLMCSYIHSSFTHDIGLKVLQSNPAVEWYQKNGFRTVTIQETFLKLNLDTTQFQPCEFRKLIYLASNV